MFKRNDCRGEFGIERISEHIRTEGSEWSAQTEDVQDIHSN